MSEAQMMQMLAKVQVETLLGVVTHTAEAGNRTANEEFHALGKELFDAAKTIAVQNGLDFDGIFNGRLDSYKLLKFETSLGLTENEVGR